MEQLKKETFFFVCVSEHPKRIFFFFFCQQSHLLLSLIRTETQADMDEMDVAFIINEAYTASNRDCLDVGFY